MQMYEVHWHKNANTSMHTKQWLTQAVVLLLQFSHTSTTNCLFLGLLGLELTLVELVFLAFQDVTVSAAGLAGAGRDAGQNASGCHLVLEGRIQHAGALAGLVLLLCLFALGVINNGGLALDGEVNLVVLQVPLTERGGVNSNDASLDQSLGTDQFVVSGVVNDINDTGLASLDFGTPGEVTSFEAQCAPLKVATHASHAVDVLLTELGVGGRATQLKLAFLAVVRALSTGVAALVASFASDT